MIGAPVSVSLSPTGRGTKVYPAYDVDRNKLVYLKIYWRTIGKGIHPELETYERLKKAGVRNTATPLAGGFVLCHQKAYETLTQNYIDNEWPAARQRYCLVTKELGRPIETFNDQKMLYHCLRDAIDGMPSVYNESAPRNKAIC